MVKENEERMVNEILLPDTNILIYAFSGLQPYANWLKIAIDERKLVLSAIVIAEFLSGATKKDEVSLKLLMGRFDILPVDGVVAQVAAEYKKKYSGKTKKVWLSDCLIAATCKVFGTTLVTFDVKDYPMNDIKVTD